ncbi:uncharacterized protein LOC117104191 isoform X2 [Anneissia japonica]|uniref:uncharacterized protein LOC117104191 isoform X2 n=1 Tax=Anneissia japonica TaxID=1529436 RepID=UPI00142587CB|nr:uncharacterized protein LOC117104191 isoform X2 [Anneissia japonica]
MITLCQLNQSEESIQTACEGTDLNLTCEGESTLDIHSTLYGRLDTETCLNDHVRQTCCIAESALQKVQEACQYQSSCVVKAENGVFGDPCFGVFKYLQVFYTCEDKEMPHVTELTKISTSVFTDSKDGQGGNRESTTKQFVGTGQKTDKGEVTYGGKATPPTTTGILERQNKGESLVEVSVGSVVSVFILIGIATLTLYFKKRKKNGSPHSVSHEMTNSIYMTNANESHSMEISDISPRHNALHDATTEKPANEYGRYPGDGQERLMSTVSAVTPNDSTYYSTLQKEEESKSQSTYMFLHHDASTTTNSGSTERQIKTEADYSYASYPGKSRMDNEEASNDSPEYCALQKEESDVIQKQNTSKSKYMVLQHDTNTTTNTGSFATEKDPESEYSYASFPMNTRTDNDKVPTDSPVYYTLPKKQDSDATDPTSNVRVKPSNTDIPKMGGLQSEYMCLQQDGSRSTAIVPPDPNAEEAESDVEYEYAYTTYQGENQYQQKPMGNADRSNNYMQVIDQGSDVINKLNVRSLQNDDAYAELRLGVNDSNEGPYDTLNHLIRTRVPDDVTDDYNKLIPTPAFDEESEEYSHLNRKFLNTDESVIDASYGKLKLSVEPAHGLI